MALHLETYENIDVTAQDSVVVIGNFDGVHMGHQSLLSRAREIADALGKSLSVLTFEPHPHQLFRPDEPPCRITPLNLKIERLGIQGVDIVFTLPFDWNFASQSAEDFITKVLKDGLKAAHVIVGYEVTAEGENLSSSRIRQLLRHGKIDEANTVLGWDWEIHGEVVKGDQRGRELGYPTANMMLGDTIHPAYGIYACFAQVQGEKDIYMGACNIGIRPMFEVKVAQVETYIFDFDQEIYGKTLRVQPVQRLRGEAKFDNLEDLITQMQKDCEQSRSLLEEMR